MNLTEYFEVINGDKTYQKIAELLKMGEAVMIGWTDNKYTHYDIMFKWQTIGEGGYQRGIKNSDLMVGIVSLGLFGFKIDGPKHYTYIGEKLFHGATDDSVQAVTELINGIIEYLNK